MSDRAAMSLARRAGLPEALRVLLAEYPREAWESRHLAFREIQATLIAETRGLIEGERDPQVFASRLFRLCGGFLDDLHGHHSIEDFHYFPRLQRLDPRIAGGFELLEADHAEIEPRLHALAERANAVLAAIRHGRPTADPAGRLEAELLELRRFLDRHLTDEEELVVPVVRAHPGAGED